ncbi:hypothetical protein IWX90DRAFT_414601 [Phyllosticta citrichinensis]|uniref:Uncharacterized protein n=1 Tax=Phyllosticta citrichinensis TaxID=1130410 RepID=A0ABR1XXZ0_9PEZI
MKASTCLGTCSGQDCSGVNDGSKNSVLMNYIPDAWNWGAEIFWGGYIVFAWHGGERSKFRDEFSELMWVRAVRVLPFMPFMPSMRVHALLTGVERAVSSLLVRWGDGDSRLTMYKMVGQKMSGNGDILSFGR